MERRCIRGTTRLLLLLMAVGLGATTPARSAAADLEVTDHAVGTAVEDRELLGRADRFPEGTRVFYWTRVVNGAKGDRIRHVWFHGDEEVVSIGLNVGGSHWRTYSSKMLPPGRTGMWAVEARDAEGRVLSRREFACDPD